MFTGLIEEIGYIRSANPVGGGKKFTVEASKIMEDLKVDDSVSINGVCQTVMSHTDRSFDFIAVEETLRKSTLKDFRPGKKVNLERAARLGDRMGGHLVQGHVDCRGTVLSVGHQETDRLVWVSFPSGFSKYVVNAGSIAIDGVSLTTARVEENKFMVTIIPHTWEVTVLRELRPGIQVNLEFDIIGKYVEKFAAPHLGEPKSSGSSLDQYLEHPED